MILNNTLWMTAGRLTTARLIMICFSRLNFSETANSAERFWAACSSDKQCKNGGLCLENSCVCKYGYTGSYCEAKLQCNDFNCVNNGTCELELPSNKTFCSCNQHAVSDGRFEGVFCEKKAPCHELGSCFNGGLCQRDPYVTDAFFCRCRDGFIGPFCEERTSCRNHANNCRHGGTCNSNMCLCVSEYTGYFCQLQVTPGISRNSEDCLSVALGSEEKENLGIRFRRSFSSLISLSTRRPVSTSELLQTIKH